MSMLDAMDAQLSEDLALSHREQDAYQALLSELDIAEAKAFDALGRYKFQMFGYWAAIWVHLNRISGTKRPSPFKQLVAVAKLKKDGAA